MLGKLEAIGNANGPPAESKKSTRTDYAADALAGAKMLCRLNCVGGGSAVKNCPLNATPKMETGTFELMNNCPVKDAVNSGNRKTAPSQTANVAVVLRRLSFSRS